ncbi:unnamed protein product, partial [Symbiodinium sp. KB8]
ASSQIIVFAQVDGGYLVAVPHSAWHRTAARRYLPPNTLSRAVLAEVLAASEVDRREAHPVWKEYLEGEGEVEAGMPARLTAVESAIGELKAGIQALLDRSGAPAPGKEAGEVVKLAGVPEAQLHKMSRLVQGARRLPAEPRAPADPLEDEEDEGEAEDPHGKGGGDLQSAVLKMSKILQLMHKDKKPVSLEDVLDRADGSGDPASSSSGGGRSKAAAYQKLRTLLQSAPAEVSRSIENCMAEDFTLCQSGPGLSQRPCTARAWVEHRSMLQSYNGPIRQAWTLGGVVDAINDGDPELAKAIALLGMAGLDQAAIDGGSWLLAGETSLEPSPPFGAFSRPRTLDQFEARQTRLLDPRWISILMGRIRERDLYHSAKKSLGGGGGGGLGGDPNAPGIQRDPPTTDPPNDSKGGAKGGKEGKGGRGDKPNRKVQPPKLPAGELADVIALRSEGVAGARNTQEQSRAPFSTGPKAIAGVLCYAVHGLSSVGCLVRCSELQRLSSARPAGKLAMNALVLVFLGQPTVCRGEFLLELGRPLNARQWRCLEGLRPSVDRWNAVETEMGRAASKFESLEGLLSKVRAGLERVGFSAAASLGSVRLKLEQPCHALPVDCDRIRFVGEPSFDPRPFLDNVSRRIYEHPLEFRKEIRLVLDARVANMAEGGEERFSNVPELIRIAGPERLLPKVVERLCILSNEGVHQTTPLWCEVPAYLRERGEEDFGVPELPEVQYEHHPMLEELCCFLEFKQLGPKFLSVLVFRVVGDPSHITLPTGFNLDMVSSGNFEELDQWLQSIGLHLDQLRELPPESELFEDVPLKIPEGDVNRRERRAQGAEKVAERILSRAVVSAADLRVLVDRLPAEVSQRSVFESRKGLTFTAGAFVHGGVVGVTRSCSLYPRSVQAFCSYVKLLCPQLSFSSLSVLLNVRALPHRDGNNLETEPNLVAPLSDFRNGEIWVETSEGKIPLTVKGKILHGELLEVQKGPCLLDHHRVHATMEWRGQRCILVAYCLRSLEKLTSGDRDLLLSLGFRLPNPRCDEVESMHFEGARAETPRAVLHPLPIAAIRQRYAIPPVMGPSFSVPSSSSSRAFGSLRVEPRVHDSGSLRVEPLSQSASEQGCRRSPAPRSGLLPVSCLLPTGVFELLASLPPSRFVVSQAFPDLRSALFSGQGWLDLFSGSRGLAKEIARAAPCWVLCYDLAHDAAEDLLQFDTQKEVLQLLDGGAFKGFSAGPVCARNAMLEFILNLVRVCESHGLIYLIENPLSSWMWAQPAWNSCSSKDSDWDFICDYCVFGTPWKKPTRFRTNGQLRSQRMRCNRNHTHTVLRGRSKGSSGSLTKAAEPYPRRLCVLLAQAVAQDAKWIEGRRPLDISRCAKCTHSRIGEASNPGPRLRPQRPDIQLRDVPLVQAATLALQNTIWSSFQTWLNEGAGAEAAEGATLLPDVLVEMLCAYGQVLYSRGSPLQRFRQLLATAQRRVPACRPLLRPAWETLTRWERLEPTQHRPPMPEPIFEAMCALGLNLGWHRWVCVTLLGFYGCCRIGEVLRATRADLQTPTDLLRTDCRFFLQIREPKTRHRGARVQHVTIVLPDEIAQFVLEVCKSLSRRENLYHGSPAVYRRRWDRLLESLGVPATFRLTPGSLRGGGAVAAYQNGEDIATLQWRMRLQHQATLAFYLQEVAAGSILPALPRHAREAIEAARSVFPFSFAAAQRASA